tara:strand:- start:5885 stop:7066 length:1182 start_codon:yes stop_codon:yes gene_type:complete
MKIINTNNVPVLRATELAISRLQKKLGYGNKYSLVAEIKDDDWIDRYAYAGWQRNHKNKMDFQAVVFKAVHCEFTFGIMLLEGWDYGDGFVAKIQITSNYLHRDKTTNNVRNIRQTGQLNGASDNSTYATYTDGRSSFAEGILHLDKLPTPFKAKIDQFGKALVNGKEAQFEPMRFKTPPIAELSKANTLTPRFNDFGLPYGKTALLMIRNSAETIAKNKVELFNKTLDDLFKTHVYEGIAKHSDSNELNPSWYLKRQLFKNPKVMRELFEAYEERNQTNLLQEIEEAEEDVEEIDNFKYKAYVRVYSPSSKTAFAYTDSEGKVFSRWFLSYSDFEEAEEDLARKAAVLNASMIEGSARSHFIAGIGFCKDETVSGESVGSLSKRIYFLTNEE